MRIGLLASTGGMLDSFFTEMVHSWRANGHVVSPAAGSPTTLDQATMIAGLTRRPEPRTIRALAGLRHWSAREELDVIVTNSATSSALVRVAGTAAPVVYFCHGLHWNETRTVGDRCWQLIEKALLRRTDGVISINSDDRRWFAARFDGRRHLHLPAGVGLDLHRYPAAQPPSGGLRLCWIGEFSSRKRPQLALETAAHLQAIGIDFHLTMLGEGSQRTEIRAAIRERGLADRISAEGVGDAAAALSASHALLHTAQWEGLPRVMLESLAIGRPSYAFDVKGVRDIPMTRLSPDGDSRGLAARIAGDWEQGRLVAPMDFDRDLLDCAHAADEIERFLATSVVTGSASPPARGDARVE